jgi:FkbH-like protein
VFEFFRYDKRLHRGEPVPASPLPARPAVAQKSFLFWGEHCVECAAPDCYATCSLYAPRQDGRCRRFEYGMFENAQLGGQPGAELVFKQWAQLGSRGNLRMEPAARIAQRERWVRHLVPWVDRVGAMVSRVTGDHRFRESTQRLLERYCRSLHRRAASSDSPDCFLFEVYNPTAETVRLQFRISSAATRSAPGAELIQIKSTYQTWLEAAPGYSRHEVAYKLFKTIAEKEAFDVSLTPEGDAAARLIVLTADFVQFKAEVPVANTRERPAIKCVVWDLDNTLWDGVLLEQESVALRPGVLSTIRDLDARGILHSTASKNSHAHAWPTIERLGLSEYLLYPQISWMPKSEGIRKVAEQLNVGLDTFAFVDDNPFELDEVRQALPQVTCIHVDDLADALRDKRFAGSSTADAKSRRSLYTQAMIRDQALQEFGTDYLKFLAHSQIVLELCEYSEEFFDRVSELVQRTNQLNFSGRKYTSAEVTALLQDPSLSKFVLRCSDRYGTYGTVGFALVSIDGTTLNVQDFMLSCRVQGKFIEQAFFRHLIEHHEVPTTRLRLNFRRTERNTPALNVLTTLGFVDDPSGGMSLPLREDSLVCDFIDTRCASCTRLLTGSEVPDAPQSPSRAP